jgi:hypothetical protein
MSERGEPDLTRLLRDLTRELQSLQREIENRDRRELSTRRQLTRFSSEVAIPGLILLLETNIRALKLLRRAIRLADGRDPRESRSGGAAAELRDRAEQLGTATLSRLDETLAEAQSALEDDGNDEIQSMVAEARELQREIRDRVEESGTDGQPTAGAGKREQAPEGADTAADDHVTIDVESELRTLKDDLEDGPNGPGTTSGETGPVGNDTGTDEDDTGGNGDSTSGTDDDSHSEGGDRGDGGGFDGDESAEDSSGDAPSH